MVFKNKKGYLWVTLAFFAISLTIHWIFAWFAYVDEQIEHGQPVKVAGYLNVTIRDTMENWQSEFLQLMWQVAGLAILLYVGSPQSKEEHDRTEEKIDFIIKKLEPESAQQLLEEWDRKYPKK
ncbi:MAG TPA: DUF6766 family protein [Nitrososphaera sp.]|jgi:hypothetical protein